MFRESRSYTTVLVVTGVLALVIGLWLYPRVFPISGLRLNVLRGEAQQIATRFLSQMGVKVPPGYTQVTTFKVVNSVKTYLEQTLGIRRANQVAQEQGFVYLWYTRWFRPGREEDYRVGVDPDGRVLVFVRRMPTDAPMPPSRRPRQVAEQFLQQTIGIDLKEYRLIGESKEPRHARVDYHYVWERTNLQLGEGRQRVEVIVSGDQVIYYSRYLHIPEAFRYSFQRQRVRGMVIATVAYSAAVIFTVILAAVLLFGAVKRHLRWKGALAPAAIVAGVYLLNALNEIPLSIAEMENDQTWAAFWTSEILGSLFSVLLRGALVLLIIAGAELVYRQAFPNAVPLYFWFTRRGWAHPEGRKRIALGYWLFAIHLLYVVLFLGAAQRFLGAWASTTVPYDDLLSTLAPWAYPLLMGIDASVYEEMLFRVFIIALFRRYLKSAWAGIIVGAVVWAAGHCSYPTVPYYLRLVELLLPGILWGWAVMQFGPLTTIVTHALYNVAVSSDIFLYSDQWPARLSFGVVMFWIALPALLSWYWSRRLGEHATIELPAEQEVEKTPPAVESPTAEAPPVERRVEFPAIPRRVLWVSAVVLLASLVLAYANSRLTSAQQRFKWAEGEANPFRVHLLDARQALEKAKGYLPAKGKEVNGWLVGVENVQIDESDYPEYQYLRRFLSQRDADALWERVQYRDEMWQVRWWQPGSRKEWFVMLTPEGDFWYRYCNLPEEAPGKKISKEQAQQIATSALKELGFPLERLRLSGSTTYQLPARSLYSFRWQVEGLQVGKAQFWVVASVNGDVATDIYREVDVPSSEIFQREVSTVRRVAGGLAIAVVALILFVWNWRVTIQVMRRYRTPWRSLLHPATAVAVLFLFLVFLRYPEQVASAPESLPPETFAMLVMVNLLIVGGLLFIVVMALAPFVPAWRALYPTLPDLTDWWRALSHPRRYRRAWRDAIMIQPAIWSPVLVLFSVIDSVELLAQPGSGRAVIPQWILQTRVDSVYAPLGIATFSPFLFALVVGMLAGLALLVAWFGTLPSLKLMFGNTRRCVLWYLLLTLPGALLFAEWWESLQYVLGAGLFLAGVWLLHRWVLRYNPLALFVFGVHTVFVFDGIAQLHYPTHRAGGVLLVAVVIASFLWAFVDWLVEYRKNRHAPASLPEESFAPDGV